MADPAPQGQAALARPTLNGVQRVYINKPFRIEDSRIPVNFHHGLFASYPAESMRKIGGLQ